MIENVVDNFAFFGLSSNAERVVAKISAPVFIGLSNTEFLHCAKCGGNLSTAEQKSIYVSGVSLKNTEKIVGFITYVMCVPCLVELGDNPTVKLFELEKKPDDPSERKED